MNHKTVFIILMFAGCYSYAQPQKQIKTITLSYNHFYYRYGDSLIKYTYYKPFLLFSFGIVSDFRNFDSFESGSVYSGFKNGIPVAFKHVRSKSTDTISNIRWLNFNIPANSNDSSIYYRKLKYSYFLHKMGGRELDETKSQKIRWYFNDDFYHSEGKWYLYTCDLNSGKFEQTISEVNDTLGFRILNQMEKTIKERQKRKLQKFLTKLEDFESVEAIDPKSERTGYPMLLEYYDGKTNHLFIYSSKKSVDKQLKKLIDHLISCFVVIRRGM